MTTLQGFPIAIAFLGMLLITTVLAPITAFLPIIISDFFLNVTKVHRFCKPTRTEFFAELNLQQSPITISEFSNLRISGNQLKITSLPILTPLIRQPRCISELKRKMLHLFPYLNIRSKNQPIISKLLFTIVEIRLILSLNIPEI